MAWGEQGEDLAVGYAAPAATGTGATATAVANGHQSGGYLMNSAANTATNAAGTSENVAMHVAIIVALALVGVYVLRQSGFRFVVAAGVGG
jgi:hypothetical protein